MESIVPKQKEFNPKDKAIKALLKEGEREVKLEKEKRMQLVAMEKNAKMNQTINK